MASNINANNIDGTFPVAGQDNDSQGFRDNFTNVKTNFTNAKTEIEDLQSNVVLKAALSGTTLDNNGAGALIKDFELRDMKETRVAKGSVSGTVTCNYAEGSYQTLTTSGSITLAFSNFPPSGGLGKIRVEITVASVAHTITLPAAVTIGWVTLNGNASRVITADTVETIILEFTTDDGGTNIAVSDITRNRNKLPVATKTNTGASGDVIGMVAVDTGYVYVCTAAYDGSTAIWKRAALSSY